MSDEFVKYAVQCGGPNHPVPPGTKLASQDCPQCGGRHPVEERPTSSGASQTSPKNDFGTHPLED